MREGRASRTAEQNALFRALETSLPEGRRLFADPLASAFLGTGLGLVDLLGRAPGLRQLVVGYIDRRWPGVRTSVVARTRLIDDAIASALEENVEQVVLLGAGFDSRAYRLAALREVPVWEVDHPDTQASKRRILERSLGAPPRHVRFAPCDFNERGIEAAMTAARFDASARTFILWEGVTNYLTESAIDTTLRWCSHVAAGSRLLFTYVHRDILTHPERFVGTENLFAALARAGERFTWGIEPEALPEFLAARGLSLESDVGAADYRRRYFGDASRTMRGHEFYRVALARVKGRAASGG